MTNFNNKKNNMKKKNSNKVEAVIRNPGDFEYKMPKAMADAILKTENSRKPIQEILCDHVNKLFGLKGTCIKVIID